MISTWKRTAALAVLGIALISWGCETATDPGAQPALQAESATGNLLGGLLGDEAGDSGESELEILERSAALLTEQVVSAVIGPAGGELELLGHQLVIPKGAVEDETKFVMIVLPGTQVQVELYAFDADGINIGEKGFEVPVQLALSYADVPGIKDPSKLSIVHITKDGEREVLETEVDEEAEKAEADLDHFSRYGLCRN